MIYNIRDNSNSFVPHIMTLDGKRIECLVSKWQLCGFVKGDHGGCATAEFGASRIVPTPLRKTCLVVFKVKVLYFLFGHS